MREATLYERVADQVEGFMAQGIYEPGERLHSIRRISSTDCSPAIEAALSGVGSIAKELAETSTPVLRASAI